MNVFQDYAEYYDLLYEDKDYRREATYVERLLRQFNPSVHGVDLSSPMLDRARSRSANVPSLSANLKWTLGNVQRVRIGEYFDAVISLFHVMSYQTTDAALDAAVNTAAQHLRPGGIFIFDFWYGPAVLAQRPEPRSKRVANDGTEVTRFCDATLDERRNVVDLTYRLEIRDLKSGASRKVSEAHSMRFLFQRDLDRLLSAHSFGQLRLEEWETGRQCSDHTWSAVCIARKKAM